MRSKSLIGCRNHWLHRQCFVDRARKAGKNPATSTAHDPLWAGIDGKLQDAQFYLGEMTRSLQRAMAPYLGRATVTLQSPQKSTPFCDEN
jgi:hypothetical protein